MINKKKLKKEKIDLFENRKISIFSFSYKNINNRII